MFLLGSAEASFVILLINAEEGTLNSQRRRRNVLEKDVLDEIAFILTVLVCTIWIAH